MEALRQIITAMYVALGEAAGGSKAMRIANRVLRDAIEDGAINDPVAIMLLESIAHDEDDSTATFTPQQLRWLEATA